MNSKMSVNTASMLATRTQILSRYFSLARIEAEAQIDHGRVLFRSIANSRIIAFNRIPHTPLERRDESHKNPCSDYPLCWF